MKRQDLPGIHVSQGKINHSRYCRVIHASENLNDLIFFLIYLYQLSQIASTPFQFNEKISFNTVFQECQVWTLQLFMDIIQKLMWGFQLEGSWKYHEEKQELGKDWA